MTQYIQNPALWALLVVTLVAAALIVRQRRAARKLRQEIAGLRNHYGELESQYSDSVRSAQQEAEGATRTALKSAMRTLQGLAAEQQLIISGLQDKYGDSVMLQDLLEIDHMNSQFGRRAQSIAVLCDGWLGRQRDVASVYDVVRSAKGRIRHYQRASRSCRRVDFALTSRAVEPVALALAELLDNATSYSSPDTVDRDQHPHRAQGRLHHRRRRRCRHERGGEGQGREAPVRASAPRASPGWATRRSSASR